MKKMVNGEGERNEGAFRRLRRAQQLEDHLRRMSSKNTGRSCTMVIGHHRHAAFDRNMHDA